MNVKKFFVVVAGIIASLTFATAPSQAQTGGKTASVRIGATVGTAITLEPGVEVSIKCSIRGRIGSVTSSKLEANIATAAVEDVKFSPFVMKEAEVIAQDKTNPRGYVFFTWGAVDAKWLAETLAKGDPCGRPGDPVLAAMALPTPTKLKGKTQAVPAASPPVMEVA